MFHASVAVLPSTSCMYAVLLGFGAWLRGYYGVGLTCGSFAVLLGMAVAAPMFVPMGVAALHPENLGFLRVSALAIGALGAFAGLPTLLDTSYYGTSRPVWAMGNHLLYNFGVGGGAGADLYGTEPWHFYAKNLLLNFNFVAALALPALCLAERQLAIKLLPMYVTLAMFFKMAHKEERFLTMTYPLICLAAAVTADAIISCVEWAVRSCLKAVGMAQALGKAAFIALVLAFWMLSLSRSAALALYFRAPLQLYEGLYYSAADTQGLCVGKEWYRFPSSFFLPELEQLPAGAMSDPMDVFNRFCQLKRMTPVIQRLRSKGSMADMLGAWYLREWNVTSQCLATSCADTVFAALAVSVGPCAKEGLGRNKQDAKLKATNDYVQILYNHGLMQTPAKFQQPSKKRKAPSMPSMPSIIPAAKRQNTQVAPGLASGPLPAGRLKAPRRPANDSQTGKIVEFLKSNRLPQALQTLHDIARAYQCLSLKQVAKFADSLGMRTSEAGCRDFFDAIDALDLAEFPSYAGQKYFGRFARWAVRDFLADAGGAINQAKMLPLPVLERNGCCLQLEACPGSKASQLLLKPSGPIPQHNFQKGDWVLLTCPHTAKPSESTQGWGALCVEAEVVASFSFPEPQLEVKVMGEAVDVTVQKFLRQRVRLDKVANHVTLSRQLEALQRVCNVEPMQQQGSWNPHLIVQAMRKANNNKDAKEPTWVKHLLLCGDSAHAGREPDLAAQEVPGLSPHHPMLLEANESQRKALLEASACQMALIQGPPGTGKTTTALLLVRAWVAARQRPVLCAADSNIAVDNLVDGCAKAQLTVVRVGRPEATRPDLEQYNLLDMVKDTEPKQQYGAQRSILGRADVVCTTCSGADHPLVQHLSFARVLLDEAAQATELATLVPLMKLRPEGCVTLVGDHRQLPPTISNIDIDVEGFGTSLFERLTTQGIRPHLLTVQYRMHPCISTFPSGMFYKGQIRSGVTGAARRPPQGIYWPVPEVPVTFLPVQGRECPEGTSWSNSSEVEAVQAVLDSLLAWDDIQAEEVGIITPYAAQARLLRRRLGCPAPGRRALAARPTGPAAVEVSSVDGFQGREKDVIIVTTVRANAAGNVGFVGDPRRLNVTLTRAKRGLVVVGNLETLSADAAGWYPWLNWAQERGLVAGCEPTLPDAAEACAGLREPFGPWPRGLHEVPPDMNDRNLREASRYSDESECSYLVDLTLTHQSEAPPDAATWDELQCFAFLDAERSRLPWRAFYVPFSGARNQFGRYCLYRKRAP
ncbi:unnamed protein product [Effrenium voratum]|nr:unnamed protein product [Effrenium voratum]